MQVRESRLRPVLPDEAVDREDHALVREVGEPRGRHLDRVERADLATCSARIFVRIWGMGASVTVILMPVSFSHSGPGEVLVVERLGAGLDASDRDAVVLLGRADSAARDPVAADRGGCPERGGCLFRLEPCRSRGRCRGCQPALDQATAPREAEPGHVLLLRHIRIVVHVVTHAFRSFLMACCMTGTPSSQVCTRRRQVRTPTIELADETLPGRR